MRAVSSVSVSFVRGLAPELRRAWEIAEAVLPVPVPVGVGVGVAMAGVGVVEEEEEAGSRGALGGGWFSVVVGATGGEVGGSVAEGVSLVMLGAGLGGLLAMVLFLLLDGARGGLVSGRGLGA
jgi:hypothetical protein